MFKLTTPTGFIWLATVAWALTVIAAPVPAQQADIVFAKSQDDDKEGDHPGSAGSKQSLERTSPAFTPRLELHIPSLTNLLSQTQRSHTGLLVSALGQMMFEMGSASAEGVDVEEAAGILRQISDWPDAAVDAATYAPDIQGRLRWAVRLDWPLSDLQARLQRILSSEAAETIFEGVTLEPTDTGGYELALPDSPLAYLMVAGETGSYIASHPDLPVPSQSYSESVATEGDEPALLVARLHRTTTEKDSGATFFSKFRIVTAVDYACRVDSQGDWNETVQVHWPPVTGMGAKLLLGRVKQTFFVPNEAFGALAIRPMGVAAMLEGLAGFGPQMMMEAPGEFSMVGEMEPGPIARRGGSDACIILLPGTGFLPVPDVVVQLRIKKPQRFLDEVREATEKLNELYRRREKPQPWQEIEVKDRPVFWSDGNRMFPGAMMPWIMRPVIFTTTETDAKDRQRDFLVVAWTSTSPERFVRRWLELPRNKQMTYLPTTRKTNGQAWINWQQAYKWIHPYINFALSAVVRDTFLPRAEEMALEINGAMITIKVKYTGLNVTHRGPIPAGTLVLPAMLTVSTMEDRSGGSDLARERLAAQRLNVLYHHCTLFKKDQGRWPAEIAELDGYIDFSGHPELLKLHLSSRMQWSKFFDGLFKSDDDESESEEEEDELVDIDDKLYVIRWGRDSWSLGLAPGTLEHLEQLYIDQDGKIHRLEKEEPKAPSEPAARESDS